MANGLALEGNPNAMGAEKKRNGTTFDKEVAGMGIAFRAPVRCHFDRRSRRVPAKSKGRRSSEQTSKPRMCFDKESLSEGV